MMDAEDCLYDRINDLCQQLILEGYDDFDAWNIACDETCHSSEDEDSEEEEEEEEVAYLSDGELEEEEEEIDQVGGVQRIVPVDVHLNEVVDLRRHWVEMSPRFGTNVMEFCFQPARQLQNEASLNDNALPAISYLDNFVEGVVSYLRKNLPSEDRVQLELVSDNLAGGGVVNPLVQVADLDEDAFLTNIQNVIQSNQDVSVDDGSVTLKVTDVAVPRGAGYEQRHDMVFKTFRDFNLEQLKSKKCLHAVDRRYDPFCGVVSLMLGCALVEAKGSM